MCTLLTLASVFMTVSHSLSLHCSDVCMCMFAFQIERSVFFVVQLGFYSYAHCAMISRWLWLIFCPRRLDQSGSKSSLARVAPDGSVAQTSPFLFFATSIAVWVPACAHNDRSARQLTTKDSACPLLPAVRCPPARPTAALRADRHWQKLPAGLSGRRIIQTRS